MFMHLKPKTTANIYPHQAVQDIFDIVEGETLSENLTYYNIETLDSRYSTTTWKRIIDGSYIHIISPDPDDPAGKWGGFSLLTTTNGRMFSCLSDDGVTATSGSSFITIAGNASYCQFNDTTATELFVYMDEQTLLIIPTDASYFTGSNPGLWATHSKRLASDDLPANYSTVSTTYSVVTTTTSSANPRSICCSVPGFGSYKTHVNEQAVFRYNGKTVATQSSVMTNAPGTADNMVVGGLYLGSDTTGSLPVYRTLRDDSQLLIQPVTASGAYVGQTLLIGPSGSEKEYICLGFSMSTSNSSAATTSILASRSGLLFMYLPKG